MGEEYDHDREQNLFHACLDLPPARWAEYLEHACGADVRLKARTARLLAAHAQAEQETLSPPLHALIPEDLTERLGPYRLVRRAGRRRHGYRLRGRATGAGAPARRAQDCEARHGHAGSRGAVHDRTAGARGHRSSVCRQGLRRGTNGRRPALLRHGVGRGRTAARALRWATALGRRASRTVHLDLPRRAARASEGCGAPRSQAIQRPGDLRRAGPVAEDHRFRHRQGCRQRLARGHRWSNTHESARWNTCLHEPRTGRVQPARCRYPDGRLLPGRDPVRVAGRVPAGRSRGGWLCRVSVVAREGRAADTATKHASTFAISVKGSCRGQIDNARRPRAPACRRSRLDRDEGAGSRSWPPLRDRPGIGRRSAALLAAGARDRAPADTPISILEIRSPAPSAGRRGIGCHPRLGCGCHRCGRRHGSRDAGGSNGTTGGCDIQTGVRVSGAAVHALESR